MSDEVRPRGIRLVAVTRILNEADIVEAFVRHAAAMVDSHVLLDNGSTDGTLAILDALQGEGIPLTVQHHSAVAFAEADQITMLARYAVAAHGADWVLPLDADEFPAFAAPSEALRATLSAAKCEFVKVRVQEYVATVGDDAANALVPERITFARPVTDNVKVIVHSSLISRNAIIEAGAHGVALPTSDGGGPLMWCDVEGLIYAHFAVRSSWQWITKFTIGWSKVLAAGPSALAAGHASHYRGPFETLKTAPADILRNPHFMGLEQEESNLTPNPIKYRGGGLRYTRPVDHQMRAVNALMTYLEELSKQHGLLYSAK